MTRKNVGNIFPLVSGVAGDVGGRVAALSILL